MTIFDITRGAIDATQLRVMLGNIRDNVILTYIGVGDDEQLRKEKFSEACADILDLVSIFEDVK